MAGQTISASASQSILCSLQYTGKQTAQHASLDRHPPLPHKGNLQQVILVITPVKEKNIPEAGADQSGKAAVNADIQHMLMPAAVLPRQKIRRAGGQENRQGEHQPVHAYGEVTYMK